MKKKLLIFTIAIVVIISVFLMKSEDKAQIMIKQGVNEKVVEKEYIYSHPEAIVFPSIVRSSGEKPVEAEYKGIELSTFFNSLDVDLNSIEKITFNATDGYRIILGIEEVNDPSNVYITFERDGDFLKSKKQGGNGPFQLVIRRDPFSQRWIKHVDQIVLE